MNKGSNDKQLDREVTDSLESYFRDHRQDFYSKSGDMVASIEPDTSVSPTPRTKACGDQLFGLWAIRPETLELYFDAIKSGMAEAKTPLSDRVIDDYSVNDGVAVIGISGPMTKAPTKWQGSLGGTATITTRRAIRAAVADPAIESIMLHIESPGGTVAGTADLANEVASADAQKPVYAHIDDLGASAAYWVASQARRVTANQTAQVGGIGVRTALLDTSKRAEMEGVKVIPVASSTMKAAGTEGAPVTPEHIKDMQRQVDELNSVFVQAVADGRGIGIEHAELLADGTIRIGKAAVSAGLIDGVESFETALKGAQEQHAMKNTTTTTSSDATTIVPDMEKVKNQEYSRGYEDGLKDDAEETQKRAQQFAKTFADRPAFALEAFAKGHTIAEAKAELADILIKEANEREAELSELRQKVEAREGPEPIGVVDAKSNGKVVAKPDGSDPKAVAEWEWDNQPESRDGFTSKENYVLYRSHELSGSHKTLLGTKTH
jgi:signal peptide peptidase SppA